MRHYRGLNNQEMLTSLPINAGWLMLYSQPVYAAPGELVQASADFSATNDTGYPVFLGTWMRLEYEGPSPAIAPIEMNEANGINITPDMHHCSPARWGSVIVPSTGPAMTHVRFYVTAKQSRDGLPPLTVERDFGRMWVNVYEIWSAP